MDQCAIGTRGPQSEKVRSATISLHVDPTGSADVKKEPLGSMTFASRVCHA